MINEIGHHNQAYVNGILRRNIKSTKIMAKFARLSLLLAAFVLPLAMAACQGGILRNLTKTQEWSENYALGDGVRCTSPEMIDGDINTVGQPEFSEYVQSKGKITNFDMTEAVITFPENKSIRKIIIRSEDLRDFAILQFISGIKDWKTIKEFKGNKGKEIVIRTSIITDKIKISARWILVGGEVTKNELDRIKGIRTIGGANAIKVPKIQEIEIYGFK